MKKLMAVLSALLMAIPGAFLPAEMTVPEGTGDMPAETDEKEEEKENGMRMTISGTPVAVTWEDNESVDALRELARNGLSIRMSMYGGFEQVGSIGRRLPRQDVQTDTSSGDIVLYAGDQLVVFYGSNSWAYTRLGHIGDKTPDEMRELLGNGDVTVTLSVR